MFFRCVFNVVVTVFWFMIAPAAVREFSGTIGLEVWALELGGSFDGEVVAAAFKVNCFLIFLLMISFLAGPITIAPFALGLTLGEVVEKPPDSAVDGLVRIGLTALFKMGLVAARKGRSL